MAERFQKLWDVLCKRNDYQPLCLLDIEPEDSMERFRWLQNNSLPVAVQLCRYCCGNYYGNLNVIWKVETIDDDKVIKAVDNVRQILLTFSTWAMRKEIILGYSREVQPALLRNIFSFISHDSSTAETAYLEKVDDTVTVFLAESDDPDLFYDMRKLNGRATDESLNPFWDELWKFLDESSIVDDRRHGEVTYLPLAISISDLIRQIKERLPEGTKCPSESWVRLQFWPTNPYHTSAVNYTERFPVKYSVQQRLLRKKHIDSKYCAKILQYIKEMAVRFNTESLMLSLDDKCCILIG